MRLRIFLLSSLFLFLSIVTGCTASTVRFDYRVPSLKEGDPYAVIIEKNPTKGFVTLSIKGFYIGPKPSPENYVEPYVADSNTKALAKVMYSMTPQGILAHAIHYNKGRIISVPSGRLGIVIHHYYYQELSRKVFPEYTIITYRDGDWDSTPIWATFKAGKEYSLNLDALELTGPEGVVPIELTSAKEDPAKESQPVIKEVIKDREGNVVPKENLSPDPGNKAEVTDLVDTLNK